MDSVEEKVVAIIKKNCCCNEKVIPTDNLKDDLGMDSLDRMAMMIDIEYEFDIQFVGDDVEKFKMVEDVIDYVRAEIR